jgi:pilus assembly protein Flp/PilA
MIDLMNRLWKEEDGQDLIEYALLVALLALTCTAAISPLATAIRGAFSNASTSLS